MQIKTVRAVWFSATGTTEKVVNFVAKGIAETLNVPFDSHSFNTPAARKYLRMILTFRAADPPAALLQIPYLLWVTFAAYLNLDVWLLNRSSAPIPALTSALCRFLPELF